MLPGVNMNGLENQKMRIFIDTVKRYCSCLMKFCKLLTAFVSVWVFIVLLRLLFVEFSEDVGISTNPSASHRMHDDMQRKGNDQEISDKIDEKFALAAESEYDFMLRIEKRMNQRKQLLNEKCKELGLSNKMTKQVRFVVSQPYKLTYCFIPKVGCTNWKKVFLLLNGYAHSYAELNKIAHENIHGIVAKKYRYDSVGFPTDTDKHLKIIVVRDPFDRLLSSFNDKFANQPNGIQPQYWKTSKDIHRKYGNSSKTGLANFEEFLTFLTIANHSVWFGVIANHWSTYERVCQPCTLNYDVIANLETIEEDARYILKLIKAPKRISYSSGYSRNGSSLTNRQLGDKLYGQVSPDLRKKIYKTYQKDFQLFGYEARKRAM